MLLNKIYTIINIIFFFHYFTIASTTNILNIARKILFFAICYLYIISSLFSSNIFSKSLSQVILPNSTVVKYFKQGLTLSMKAVFELFCCSRVSKKKIEPLGFRCYLATSSAFTRSYFSLRSARVQKFCSLISTFGQLANVLVAYLILIFFVFLITFTSSSLCQCLCQPLWCPQESCQ